MIRLYGFLSRTFMVSLGITIYRMAMRDGDVTENIVAAWAFIVLGVIFGALHEDKVRQDGAEKALRSSSWIGGCR